MKTAIWDFALVVEGCDILAEQVVETLYEQIEDEVSPGRSGDLQLIDFSREGASLEATVISAISDVERIGGIEVVGVIDETLVSLEEIAERAGLTIGAVRAMMDGDRGARPFPDSVDDPLSAETRWPWREVADWIADKLGARPANPSDDVFTALSDSLQARRSCRKLGPEQRRSITALTAG